MCAPSTRRVFSGASHGRLPIPREHFAPWSASVTVNFMASVSVVSPEQLTALVTEAVTAALAQLEPTSHPALLDRNGLARACGVSPSHIDQLRKRGLPTV